MLFAPRIAPRLRASLARHARSPLTPAEITRRLGAEAERRGLTRPCYEQVRVLVRQARRVEQRRPPFELEVGFGFLIRTRAPVRPVGIPLLPLRFLPRLRL